MTCISHTPKIDTEAIETLAAKIGRTSLRAYAMSIDETPGYLSQILNGKRPMSKRLRAKLHLKTKYPPHPVVRWSRLASVLTSEEYADLRERVNDFNPNRDNLDSYLNGNGKGSGLGCEQR